MSTIKINAKNVFFWVGGIGVVLTALGLSWGGVTGRLGDIIKAPVKIEMLEAENRRQDSIIAEQAKIIHHLEIQGRMSYETDKILTDLINDSSYEIEPREGEKYDIVIRGTNEGAEIVFIEGLWLQYPLYRNIDDRMYITLHDPDTHKREGTYIKLKN